MKEILINLCKNLDGRETTANKLVNTKCEEFFQTFLSSYKNILEFPFLAILMIFTLLTLLLIFKNDLFKISKINKLYLTVINFTLFYFTIMYLFPTEFIWVDDWAWTKNLIFKEQSNLEWIFTGANIHFILVPKILYLVIYKFFDMNFAIYNYLSIIILFITSIIFINEFLKKKDLSLLILIMILLFHGKQFPNFTQASNISWTICLFFVVLFVCNFKKFNFLNILFTSISLLFSPMTLGIGFIVPIYAILISYFLECNKKIKIFYVILSIFSLAISFYIPHSQLLDRESYNYFTNLLNINFYLIFFGILANVFLPWLKNFALVGFSIGLLQSLFILTIFIKLKNFQSFLLNNPLIIMGFLFAGLVSFTRPTDLATISAARYSTGSIIFQIGFWILFVQETANIRIKKILIINLISLYILVLGIFAPYFGFHWQIVRNNLEEKIIYCFKHNKSNYEQCKSKAYDILMYKGKWYKYETFSKQIDILKKEKKSLFRLP